MSTANTANNNASSAVATANAANTNASNAVNTANDAQTAASTSVQKADVYYYLSDSPTELTGGGWGTQAPTWSEGKYIWTKTLWTLANGTTSWSDESCVTGSRGTGIHKITTAPSSYTTTIGGFKPSFRIALGTVKTQAGINSVMVGDILERASNHYTVGYVTDEYVYLGAATSIKGDKGNAGINSATIYLYQRSDTKPTKPSGDIVYTFSSKSITSGTYAPWKTSIEDGTQPCWITMATASATTATDTIPSSEWTDPVKMVENGEAGFNHATIYLYQRSATQPSKPSAAITYTFSTGTLSSVSGWSTTVPTANGNPCWVTTAAAISQSDTYSIPTTAWADVSKLVEDAKVYILDVSSASLKLDSNKQISPNTLTISAYSRVGNNDAQAYTGRFKMQVTTNGTSWTDVYTPNADESTKTITLEYSANSTTITKVTSSNVLALPSTTKAIKTILYAAGGTTTMLDNQTTVLLVDGVDGNSVTITGTSVKYQEGSSGTTAPTGTWKDSIPSVADGKYLWTRTTVTYSDGNETISDSVAR